MIRFIHLSDVHLGAVPDRGCPWSHEREEEIWETFRRVIVGIRKNPVDLLFIAGDLFHRQPLLRELREVDDLFASVKLKLRPFALRSYQNLVLTVDQNTTQYALEDMLRREVMKRGGRNIYRLIIKGKLSPDNVLLPERLHGLGNIVEIMDESRPAYQLESLYRQYRGTLIGDYIKTFLKRDLTVVEKKALYYGLQALLTTKVLTSDRKRI